MKITISKIKPIIFIVILGCLVSQANAWRNSGHVRGKYYPENENNTPINYSSYAGIEGILVEIKSIWNGSTIASGYTNTSGYYNINWNAAYGRYILKISGQVHLENSLASTSNEASKSYSRNFTTSSNYVYNKYWATDGTNAFYHINKVNDYFTDPTIGFPGLAQFQDLRMRQGSEIGWGVGYGNWVKFGSWLGSEWAKSSDVVENIYCAQLRYQFYNYYFPPDYSSGRALDMYFPCSRRGESQYGESVLPVSVELLNSYTMDADYENYPPGWWPNFADEWDAQILGGAYWDTRSSTGSSVTDKIVYESIVPATAFSFEELMDNILLADWNTYGLAHGTQINNAFNAHGIYSSCNNCHGGGAMGKSIAYEEDSADINLSMPHRFNFSQNHPNPFNSTTTIQYDLPVSSYIELKVYDFLGKEINRLVYGNEEAGFKQIEWNGTDQYGKPVASGMYIYKINAISVKDNTQFTQSRKMVMIK